MAGEQGAGAGVEREGHKVSISVDQFTLLDKEALAQRLSISTALVSKLVLDGGAGNDEIVGSNLKDLVDSIIGGIGSDRLTGGAGVDEFHESAGSTGMISDVNVAGDVDTLVEARDAGLDGGELLLCRCGSGPRGRDLLGQALNLGGPRLNPGASRVDLTGEPSEAFAAIRRRPNRCRKPAVFGRERRLRFGAQDRGRGQKCGGLGQGLGQGALLLDAAAFEEFNSDGGHGGFLKPAHR
jgi:hypothetical protein